mgnify:CR=1 FL=1|tara:strand:+ start:1250 stop:1774 length:525 start_codon:yes stop_codon:yes gene_type:complete
MANRTNHIFIIGMMGAGKSSVAPLLSSKLNMPYIDTDKDLIEIMDAEIKEIFASITKEKFYHLESTYFLEHIKGTQHIYATGGGIILNKSNRDALKKHGRTIFLEASITTLYNRLKSDSKTERPLVTNNITQNSIQKIWLERKQYYQDCAEIIINTNNKTNEAVIEEILQSLKR